ncbi:chitobiase/beta-hexosaminidase C-terminal domain-containing protein [Aurantibacter sp.]|uniref:chitobiase/beta-hexosaminidase C-terminal domain-containing protein n=1 Tax=Aurantibacter sp. TaxID=2807103 RepID=UPI003265CDE1
MRLICKLCLPLLFVFSTSIYGAEDIFISVLGNDKNNGTKSAPFASFDRAVKELVKYAGNEAVTVWFTEGTYYLDETILLDSSVSGTEKYPIVFSNMAGAEVIIKGSKLLEKLRWKKYNEHIYVTKVPTNLSFDQLFINGKRQVRARFPDYDYENPLRGGRGYLQVADGTNRRYDKWITIKEEDIKNKDWKHPETGILHAFQSHNWGNMQYRIKDYNALDNKIYLGQGGWQLQRAYGVGGKGVHASWFFIENIFEELTVAGEWFLDEKEQLLYYNPENGVDLSTALVEVPVLKDLIQIKGSQKNPVKHITIKGIDFTQSAATFMETYEPVARGDWAIHRGGAIYLEGAEDCIITDANFEYLGGNGVFMSSYNRNNSVSNSRFYHIGESAVALVGSPDAVRFYQTWDDKEILGKDWLEMRKNMDLKPGPKSPNYPKSCVIENNIMYDFGDYGKQVAGVYISMSHKITVAHNTIYNCPRAAICINDGTWGGHIIEYNDIWETVRETGEHGPFNSWGRERQWLGAGGNADTDFIKKYVKLDAIDPVIIRNNRIANHRQSISAGNWTIDLDDGSSNYEIYNNLNLGSSIKLRDGMYRKVFNNITVSAVPLGWHVWPKASEDEVFQNIFVITGKVPGEEAPTNIFIRPISMTDQSNWSNNYDYNLYWNVNYPENNQISNENNFEQWKASGYDLNSKIDNPLFVNPENGDYSVADNSPALQLGFKNFAMDNFGHQMTRAIPFGSEFENEIEIKLISDSRLGENGSIRYTTDGSEPTIKSRIYSHPLKFQKSVILKFRNFNTDGSAIGFVNSQEYKKVSKKSYPSWLGTLLSGKYEGLKEIIDKKPINVVEVYGASIINIADDPDLIDASGGYNTGCFIKSIDPKFGVNWVNSGLVNGWVIQAVNDEKVADTTSLISQLNKYKGSTVKIRAVRNYQEKVFRLAIAVQ